MAKAFQFYLSAEAVTKTLEILRSVQEHEIAHRIERQFEAEKASREAAEAAEAALEEYRAMRATNAELTKRQAECLAAVRAGKGPFQKPYYWTDAAGVKQWRWQYARSMGGAVNRMITTLIEEGLLSKSRWELTPGGAARLEAWEAANGGRIGP